MNKHRNAYTQIQLADPEKEATEQFSINQKTEIQNVETYFSLIKNNEHYNMARCSHANTISIILDLCNRK